MTYPEDPTQDTEHLVIPGEWVEEHEDGFPRKTRTPGELPGAQHFATAFVWMLAGITLILLGVIGYKVIEWAASL